MTPITRGEKVMAYILVGVVVFSLGGVFYDWLERLDDPTLTVQHPTLETVAGMTHGNLMKLVALKKGTGVLNCGTREAVDSVYYTSEHGFFRLASAPGEIVLVKPPYTLWEPDSVTVRLDVVK